MDTNTITTHLPHFHLAPELSILSWNYDGDVIHFEMEEPFGIQELDLCLIVGLRKDGTVSDDPSDILTAQAVSAINDTRFELDPDLAHEILTDRILPYIEENFPLPSKKSDKK